jgi:hypothetical protein
MIEYIVGIASAIGSAVGSAASAVGGAVGIGGAAGAAGAGTAAAGATATGISTGAVLAGAGLATSVGGTLYSANQNAHAGTSQQNAERRNAYISNVATTEKINQLNTQNTFLSSRRKAMVGASGAENTGSPLLAEMFSQAQYDRDLLNIKMGGDFQAGSLLQSGRDYSAAGTARARGTLLTGMTNTFNTMYRNGWMAQ